MSHRTLALLLAATFVAAGCRHERAASEHPATARVAVAVAPVTRQLEPVLQPVAGTVRPLDHASVAARVAGLITDASFAVGQSVNSGELLLSLQAAELAARSAQARATLDQAERDAAREAKLVAEGASTMETARVAEDRLRAARAAVDEATTLLGYTRVTAPFDGVVTRKLVNTGDYAAPGTPLFEIEAREPMRVELAVPENLPVLPLGETIRIRRGGEIMSARLTEASPALDPVTRTRTAILEFPAGTTIRSGEFVHALWPAGNVEIVRAPAAAVRPVGQIERAYVVIEGNAVLRIVRTGPRENGQVQILAGLAEGELVVVDPPAGLRDGQPVALP